MCEQDEFLDPSFASRKASRTLKQLDLKKMQLLFCASLIESSKRKHSAPLTSMLRVF